MPLRQPRQAGGAGDRRPRHARERRARRARLAATRGRRRRRRAPRPRRPRRSKTLLIAPNLGWTETAVAALLADRLDATDLPIRVGNDADLGALAELWDGVGRELHDFVFVYGAIGVGAGIVMGGELLRGSAASAGELGHVTVDRDGPRCACGNTGCLELYVGQDALLRRAGMSLPPGDGVARWPTLLAETARRGDRRVLEALAEVGGWLSIGLGSLVNLFNPSAVVLGGYFAPLAEWLVEGVEREVGVHVLGARWSGCRVLVSTARGRTPPCAARRLSSSTTCWRTHVSWDWPRASDPRRRRRRQRLTGLPRARLLSGSLTSQAGPN